jgi:hypothetical protein
LGYFVHKEILSTFKIAELIGIQYQYHEVSHVTLLFGMCIPQPRIKVMINKQHPSGLQQVSNEFCYVPLENYKILIQNYDTIEEISNKMALSI